MAAIDVRSLNSKQTRELMRKLQSHMKGIDKEKIARVKEKALGVEVKDDQDEPAIMKAVVAAKLGDACKDWNDDQFAASFASLTKDAKVETTDALRSTIASRPIITADGSAVRNAARAAQYN